MTQTFYTFSQQLTIGKQAELLLDELFLPYFTIQPVSLEIEKEQGIDRIFTRKNGQSFTVEYKADSKALSTGNLFFEYLVHGANYRKDGWAVHSKADKILYMCFNDKLVQIFIMQSEVIKRQWDNIKKYKSATCYNQNIQGEGYLVPIYYAKEISEKVLIYS